DRSRQARPVEPIASRSTISCYGSRSNWVPPPNSQVARCMASSRHPLLKRIGTLALIVVAIVFAVQGGEFGTLDLFRQRTAKARISRSVDSVTRVVDSLKAYKDKVERDPATQERIA